MSIDNISNYVHIKIPDGFPNHVELLEIAESANPPEELPSGPEWGEFDFPAKNGWTVRFFYDGDLDYIDSFIHPNGLIFDIWEQDYDNSEGQSDILQLWRGMGDLARLMDVIQNDAGTPIDVRKEA